MKQRARQTRNREEERQHALDAIVAARRLALAVLNRAKLDAEMKGKVNRQRATEWPRGSSPQEARRWLEKFTQERRS